MNASSFLAVLNLALGGLVFLLGLVILRENLRQRLNRVVAFMLFFGGLGSILAAIDFIAPPVTTEETGGHGVIPAISQNFSYLWEFFFPTLFLFASVFPRERPFTRRFRKYEILLFAPHTFHFLLLLGISFLGSEPNFDALDAPTIVKPFLGLAELLIGVVLAVHAALFSLVNLGYGVASVVLLFRSYREASVRRLREQLRVIGGGLTVGLVLYSFSSSIPQLLDFPIRPAIRALLTVAALIVASGSIAYSMVRYKFLDTKLLARRGILYGLASALVVGIYLLVVSRVNRALTGLLGVDARILEPVFLIIALILFQPVIARLEERLEQLFIRDPADYRNVLRRLARDLLTEIDLDAVLSRSAKTLAEALLLRSAYVVAFAREGPVVTRGGGPEVEDEDLLPLPGILSRVDAESDAVRVADIEETFSAQERDYLVRTFVADVLVPLRSKGETVGALVLGPKVTGTEYTPEDLTLLSDLAHQMGVSIQNGLLLRDRVAVARIEEEMILARNIQARFLPSSFPAMERLEVHGANAPSREVGGDFFDLVETGDGTFFLAIADVSGKGVGAALLTSMLQASLRTQAEAGASVSGILRNMNALLYRSTPADQFVTIFLARVDPTSLTMAFSNAGHNYPFVCRCNGERVYLTKGSTILGMFAEFEIEEDRVSLQAGDRIVFFTDGINEAENEEGEMYGEERLHTFVDGLPPDLAAEEMTARILGDLRGFLDGVEAQDDVTVMVLRVLENRRSPTELSPEAVGADGR